MPTIFTLAPFGAAPIIRLFSSTTVWLVDHLFSLEKAGPREGGIKRAVFKMIGAAPNGAEVNSVGIA